jgi:hypothetical protein
VLEEPDDTEEDDALDEIPHDRIIHLISAAGDGVSL